MSGKKIFLMILVLILAVSAVSASDNATDDIVCADDSIDGAVDTSDEVSVESPKTFSDLNASVNGKNNSNVYLEDDYAFNLTSDTDFKEGIVIDRNLTVHGNGHTLNGNNQARIFEVKGGNVIFENIIFLNGNSAGNGGAVSGNCTAINCTFIGNSAGSHGGALYGGTADTCVFANNTAGIDGNDTYGTGILTPVLNVSDFTSAYNSGEKLKYSFTTASGTPINGAEMKIETYKDSRLVCIYYCLSGDSWIVNFDVGVYETYLSVDYRGFEVAPARATLTIKKQPKVVASDVKTTYKVTKNVIIYLKDGEDNPIGGVDLIVYLNGRKVLTTDENGKVKLSTKGLIPGDYFAYVTFAGNSECLRTTGHVNVKVMKIASKLTASKKTYLAKTKTKKYSVVLKSVKNNPLTGSKVSLKINGKTYWAKTDSNGKAIFTIPNIVGTYHAVISYAGGKYCSGTSKTVKIVIKKSPSKLIAENKKFSEKTKVKKYSVFLKTDSNKPIKKTKVIFKFMGKSHSVWTNSKGKATFEITDFEKRGTFKLFVKFEGNNHYKKAAKTVWIKIRK